MGAVDRDMGPRKYSSFQYGQAPNVSMPQPGAFELGPSQPVDMPPAGMPGVPGMPPGMPPGGGGFMPDLSGMGGAFDVPTDMFGAEPSVNVGGNMLGGGGDIKDVMSWQNPNITPLLDAGMRFKLGRESNYMNLLANRMNVYGQLGSAGIGAGANMYGSYLQNQAAMENARIQDMIAQARYGAGGLESQALANQMSMAEMPWAYKREMMQTPLLQSVLGGGGQRFGLGGEMPSGASLDGGMAEQEMARRELSASGRRAANEAAQIKGSVEAATGPGGGMAAGPSEQVASNRAAMMRLQAGMSERAAERQRQQEMALASRGQSLGLVSSLLG